MKLFFITNVFHNMILKTFDVIRLTLYVEHQTSEKNNALFNQIEKVSKIYYCQL